MPAYRSPAEAEVRDAVVARLRQHRPQARIMHEVNCSLFGPNRIDVIAVSPAEIISVEVKSRKDKLDRLPAQIASMRGMSHHVIAALHEKFLVERPEPTNRFAAHYERDGEFWMRCEPPEAKGAIPWIYPETRRAMMDVVSGGNDFLAVWRKPQPAIQAALPGAIDMLWAEEMRDFCALVGIEARKSDSRARLLPLIRWRCTGEQITKGVCQILRARRCIEADPEMFDPHADSLRYGARQ